MRRRMFWPFVAPATALFVVFFVGPTIGVIWISLNEWAGAGPMSWRGLKNYVTLVQDPTFQTAFSNSMKILVLVGGCVFLASFALTAALREMKGKRLARSIIFFPVLVSGIVIALVWGILFQHGGTVNSVLGNFGVEPISWLNSSNMFTMIGLGMVWINVGLYTTIILAGVDRIPIYLYEEASLAGANAWQRFRYVTLPLSRDVVSVAAVLWTIESIKIFEFIFAFGGTTNDMPPTSVWNSALFVYGESFGSSAYRFGYASASALLMLLVFTAFVVLLRRLTHREPLEF
ncbi:carbohydrate ABC transporter permease [Phytoactinopolyspora endophytica]|uniref:carbohydrate ABC transporter permease n=1 Tax=Phytoactinopolyspora endophytica TaxID=1642495 RepID=UPI00101DE7FA|nr:sugar ABC transporter permease [Phytoactinopolyspora endophytica]